MALNSQRDLGNLDDLLRNLASLGLPELEAEILRQLIKGKRTVPELVELMFGLDRSASGFHSHYMRVWRALREMESRGLVSTPILGRDKSYRLTRHGAATLLGVAPGGRSMLFGRLDLFIFLSTVVMGVFSKCKPTDVSILACFFLLGASTYRIVLALGSVW